MTKYVSAGVLSDRLGLSTQTIRKMMLGGEFPMGTFFISGKTARFDADAIEDYLLSVAGKRAQHIRASSQDENQLNLPFLDEDMNNE